jgi:hypothetical protein
MDCKREQMKKTSQGTSEGTQGAEWPKFVAFAPSMPDLTSVGTDHTN